MILCANYLQLFLYDHIQVELERQMFQTNYFKWFIIVLPAKLFTKRHLESICEEKKEKKSSFRLLFFCFKQNEYAMTGCVGYFAKTTYAFLGKYIKRLALFFLLLFYFVYTYFFLIVYGRCDFSAYMLPFIVSRSLGIFFLLGGIGNQHCIFKCHIFSIEIEILNRRMFYLFQHFGCWRYFN